MMNTAIVTVGPDDTTDRAIALMLQHRISGLPVVDEAECLIGIVSEYDLLELTCDCWTDTNRVRDYMSTEVLTVDEQMCWTDAARTFRSNHMRRLPVMRDDKLVGIITRRDVVRFIQEVRDRIHEKVPWSGPTSKRGNADARLNSFEPWPLTTNDRLLLIDDSPAVHDDFRDILARDDASTASAPEGASSQDRAPARCFTIDSAYRGEVGLGKIRAAVKEGSPYAMVFVDGHLPHGWQGDETVMRIQREYRDMQIVFCTSYSDHSSEELAKKLEENGRFFVLKKPIDRSELRQLALALAHRKRMERELYDHAASLEEARNNAQAASRAKSEFIANLTHEIRTPMNAILGFSQTLMNEPLAAAQLEKLHYIHDSGKTLLRLIDDILDYSQLSAGALKLQVLDLDLNAVVGDIVEAAAPAARNKGLSIAYHADGSMPPLRGDQVRLRQVVRNLLDNAIKFTERGRIDVHTRLEEQTDRTVTLRLTVADTGIGIPRRSHEAIFDGFFQMDGSSTRQFEGIGLGLAICRSLMELMGGEIGVDSTPGEGSSFSITLKLEKSSKGHCLPTNQESHATLDAPALPVLNQAPAGQAVECEPEDCIQKITDALAAENLSELEEHSQSLRCLAIERGLATVAKRALRIRLASRNGDLKRVASAIQELRQAYQEDTTITI